jgi:hypothetical protein
VSDAEVALARAISRAYEALADVETPVAFDAPAHRRPKALLEQLTAGPVRTLTQEQLGAYAGWAMTTVGEPKHYQYFLPRILEIATEMNSHMGYEPFVIAGKLVYGHWEDWAPTRRSAVLAVFETAFAVSLAREHRGPPPHDWLSGLARLAPVTAYLDMWRDDVRPWAAIHLASFRRSWIDCLAENGQAPPFWQEVEIGSQAQVEAWLLSTEARRQIERALPLAPEEELWTLNQALPDQ